MTDGLLEAGRVGRPHGLDGSFHVTRPDARLLAAAERDSWSTAGRSGSSAAPARRSVRSSGSRAIAGRDAAEALRGAQLSVPADRAPALEEGEYWAHELAGCAVVDGERRVGEVRRMLPLPSCEALEVALDDGWRAARPDGPRRDPVDRRARRAGSTSTSPSSIVDSSTSWRSRNGRGRRDVSRP